MSTRFLVLVGSTRTGSFNARLAEVAATHLPDDTTVEVYEGLDRLPFFSEETEHDVDPEVERLRSSIAGADALIVSTPEYNASIPGLLKNAIDWASRPRQDAALAGKPIAVLGATPSPGATRTARAHLVEILERAGARPLPTTVGVALAPQAFDDTGLIDDDLAAAVAELITDLAATPVAA